ncbi:aldo/keto reductase [Streptomyces sp. NPDC058695]|uniref:aldo/keto reductase n=1 Tax=Streptomyces sp. NPDC058695 TaxID=3346604 RepID=UPI0036562BA3
MIYCGIDWAEHHHDVALADDIGQLAAKLRINDDAAGYRELLGLLAQRGDTAWVLRNPVVSAPIVGATKPHHLADVAAALDIQLTGEEARSLEEPYVSRMPTYF